MGSGGLNKGGLPVPQHVTTVRCVGPDVVWPDHYEVRIPLGQCQPGMMRLVGFGVVLVGYLSVFMVILNGTPRLVRCVPAPMFPLSLTFGKKGG